MPADLLLEEDRVRCVEATLVVDKAIEVGAGDDTTTIARQSIRTEFLRAGSSRAQFVSADRLSANEIEGERITLGRGSVAEPRPSGLLVLLQGFGVPSIQLDGEHANLWLGGGGSDGDIIVKNESDETTIGLNGRSGNLSCGSHGTDGDVILMDRDGRRIVHLDSGRTGPIDDTVTVYVDGREADIVVGRATNEGSVTLLDALGMPRVRIGGYGDPTDIAGRDAEPDDFSGRPSPPPDATRVRISHDGTVELGGDNRAGELRAKDGSGVTVAAIDGARASLTLGDRQSQTRGRLALVDAFGESGCEIEGGQVEVSVELQVARLTSPRAFRQSFAVELSTRGMSLGRLDEAGNREVTLSALTDGTLQAKDVSLDGVSSLTQRLADLETRIRALETRIQELSS